MICPICKKEFKPVRKTQKLCRDPECKRAAWNAYMRERMAKKKAGLHSDENRTDPVEDKDEPLPPSKVIVQSWSNFRIFAELVRLDKSIARCRANQTAKGA